MIIRCGTLQAKFKWGITSSNLTISAWPFLMAEKKALETMASSFFELRSSVVIVLELSWGNFRGSTSYPKIDSSWRLPSGWYQSQEGYKRSESALPLQNVPQWSLSSSYYTSCATNSSKFPFLAANSNAKSLSRRSLLLLHVRNTFSISFASWRTTT